MLYTAVMVPMFGFMAAVVSAIVIYAIAYRWVDKKKAEVVEEEKHLAA